MLKFPLNFPLKSSKRCFLYIMVYMLSSNNCLTLNQPTNQLMDKVQVKFDRRSNLWHRPTSAGWVFFQARPHQRPPGSDRITTRLCVFQQRSCSLLLSSLQEADSERASHWPGSSGPSAGSTCLNRAGSGWWVWTCGTTRTHQPTHTMEHMTPVHLYIVMSHIVFVVKMKQRQLPITGKLNLGYCLHHVCKFGGVAVKFHRWVERNFHCSRSWRTGVTRERNGVVNTSIIWGSYELINPVM